MKNTQKRKKEKLNAIFNERKPVKKRETKKKQKIHRKKECEYGKVRKISENLKNAKNTGKKMKVKE